jgi:hypothetical protein
LNTKFANLNTFVIAGRVVALNWIAILKVGPRSLPFVKECPTLKKFVLEVKKYLFSILLY